MLTGQVVPTLFPLNVVQVIKVVIVPVVQLTSAVEVSTSCNSHAVKWAELWDSFLLPILKKGEKIRSLKSQEMLTCQCVQNVPNQRGESW